MIPMHQGLASGRWNELSLLEQLGHVGSEVERALNWKKKNRADLCMRAVERALELMDLTLDCPGNRFRLKESARTREMVVDYFYGENQFRTSGECLSSYFLRFAVAAGRNVATEKST
jgi:hypothetical protein